MSGWRTLVILTACVFMPLIAEATDPISAGYVSWLSSRNGYVMFKVVAADGTQHCAPCPADPGNMSAGGYCWIAETDRTKLGVLFMARAQSLQISGRVSDLATNCTMYQMTLRDS